MSTAAQRTVTALASLIHRDPVAFFTLAYSDSAHQFAHSLSEAEETPVEFAPFLMEQHPAVLVTCPTPTTPGETFFLLAVYMTPAEKIGADIVEEATLYTLEKSLESEADQQEAVICRITPEGREYLAIGMEPDGKAFAEVVRELVFPLNPVTEEMDSKFEPN